MPIPVTIPVTLVLLGTAAEGGWAWFDPNFFEGLWVQSDLDERVELINNYFQNLYRSGSEVGLTLANSQAMRELDAAMGSWVTFKADYDKAIFKMVGRDWEAELDTWAVIFEERRQALSAEAKEAFDQALLDRGVDPRLVDTGKPGMLERLQDLMNQGFVQLQETAKSPFFWPVVGAVAFAAILTIGIVVARRRKPPTALPSAA